MKFEDIVLAIGGVLTGLLAGVFYAFSVSIVPALRALTGREHIVAMQSINRKILNPVFFLSFFGPCLLLPLAAFLHWGRAQFGLLVLASVLHIVGAVGVTSAGNVPLNDKLEIYDANRLSEAEADQIRKAFQGPGTPWMRLHNVRTLASIVATALVFLACLSKSVSR